MKCLDPADGGSTRFEATSLPWVWASRPRRNRSDQSRRSPCRTRRAAGVAAQLPNWSRIVARRRRRFAAWPKDPGCHSLQDVICCPDERSPHGADHQRHEAAISVHLSLSFSGIARYAIVEYVPDGTGWKTGKVIQADGNSADAQADVYDLTALAAGERRLVAIGSNMSSATGDEDVSVTARFTQAGEEIHSDKKRT